MDRSFLITAPFTDAVLFVGVVPFVGNVPFVGTLPSIGIVPFDGAVVFPVAKARRKNLSNLPAGLTPRTMPFAQ